MRAPFAQVVLQMWNKDFLSSLQILGCLSFDGLPAILVWVHCKRGQLTQTLVKTKSYSVDNSSNYMKRIIKIWLPSLNHSVSELWYELVTHCWWNSEGEQYMFGQYGHLYLTFGWWVPVFMNILPFCSEASAHMLPSHGRWVCCKHTHQTHGS